MEVHHHSHHGKKKWTEYFWEFLMLFLAVFCGFLAEYQLEHIIENQREKKYMVSMLEDLKSDTALLASTSKYWDNINTSIDSVTQAIQFPFTRSNEIKTYWHLNSALDYYSFSYNDRTIAQLKNSGGFRMIRKKQVANKIILFDQFNNDAMKNIAEMHASLYKIVMELNNKVFVQEIVNELFSRYKFTPGSSKDSLWMDSLLQKNKNPLPHDTYEALLFEFKNALLSYRKDYTQNMRYGYVYLKKDMEELIKLIGEEYHIK